MSRHNCRRRGTVADPLVLEELNSLMYRYRSLVEREFRILLLGPGLEGGVLSASLRHVSLDDNPQPQYETTSYAWGNPTDRATMNVDGKILNIPESAAEVLRHVRKPSNVRSIWIDAICIDQSDIGERGRQVALMRDIYSRGSQNLIFLGTSDGLTAAGLRAADNVRAEIAQRSGGACNIYQLLYADSVGLACIPDEPSEQSYDHRALHSFYRRPWFSRLWVLQEATLSPSSLCLCGGYSRPLFDLLAPAAYLIGRCILEQDCLSSFGNASFIFYTVYRGHCRDSRRSLIRFEVLLDISRRFHASVLQDYVFAVLGLLSPDDIARLRGFESGSDILLRPDYSISVAEAFTNASRAALLLHPRFYLLQFIDHNDQLSVLGQDLPSWVFPLSLRAYPNAGAAALRSRYDAGGNSPTQGISHMPSDTLLVKGRSIDEAMAVGPTLSRDTTWSQTYDFVRASARVANVISLYDESCKQLQRLSRTLIAGLRRTERQHVFMGMPAGFSAWLKFFETKSHGEDPLFSTYDTAFVASYRRKVFRTTSGLLGLGPRVMQEGDQLVIFYQSYWPSIIRPAADGRHHHFVGHCYVDGMMDGEAFANSEVDSGRDRCFNLR